MPPKRRQVRRKRRRRGRQVSEITDQIGLNIPAASTVHYLQSDIPVDVGRRSYRIVSATAFVSSTVPQVCQLRLLDPAYTPGETTIATSGPIALGTIPKRIFVRMPRMVDPVPAGRTATQPLISIDNCCISSLGGTLQGIMRVVIRFSQEFQSEACPTLRVLTPASTSQDLTDSFEKLTVSS